VPAKRALFFTPFRIRFARAQDGVVHLEYTIKFINSVPTVWWIHISTHMSPAPAKRIRNVAVSTDRTSVYSP
jgi:hypothetical protein